MVSLLVKPERLMVRVRVNDPNGGRRPVVAETVCSGWKTLWVRLRDGNIVKRKFKRDVE